MGKFKKGQTVLWKGHSGDDFVRGRVLTRHRDGTYKVKAQFFVKPSGDEIPGYLGFNYEMRESDLSVDTLRTPT